MLRYMILVCAAMMALGCSSSTDVSFDDDDDVCGACESDDALCYPPLTRNGHCYGGKWTMCFDIVCNGVAGCSNDKMFESNGDNFGECPDGCFATCRP